MRTQPLPSRVPCLVVGKVRPRPSPYNPHLKCEMWGTHFCFEAARATRDGYWPLGAALNLNNFLESLQIFEGK